MIVHETCFLMNDPVGVCKMGCQDGIEAISKHHFKLAKQGVKCLRQADIGVVQFFGPLFIMGSGQQISAISRRG